MDKAAEKLGTVKQITSKKGDGEVTELYDVSDNAVKDDHCLTPKYVGTNQKHVEGVSFIDQDKDPEFKGPEITDDQNIGGNAHSASYLET